MYSFAPPLNDPAPISAPGRPKPDLFGKGLNRSNLVHLSKSTHFMSSQGFIITTPKPESLANTPRLRTNAEKDAFSQEEEVQMKKMSNSFRTISDGILTFIFALFKAQ